MNSNSPASPCFDPAFGRQEQQKRQQQQNSQCSLPLIPYDLVQPLRDALPKIDEALLSTVPLEALPLCQQLFNAWISTNAVANVNIAPPSRAKTTMNVASFCQPSSPTTSLSNQQHLTQPTVPSKQCRKSQSTSRLSSWFSWSTPKRKNTSVAPMVLEQKKSTNQNISDPISVNATRTLSAYSSNPPPQPHSTEASKPQQKYQFSHPHSQQRPHRPQQTYQSHQLQKPKDLHTQQHHRHDQAERITLRSHPSYQQKQHSLELSSSLSSSLSTTSSTSTPTTPTCMSMAPVQKPNDRNHTTGYRRSISFMLSKFGTKVRKAIQSGSQRIHPQLKSVSSSITMSLSSSSQNHLTDSRRLWSSSSSAQRLYSKKTQTSADPSAALQKMEQIDAAEINQRISTRKNSNTKQSFSPDIISTRSTQYKENNVTYSTDHSSQQYLNIIQPPNGKDTQHDLRKSPIAKARRFDNVDTTISITPLTRTSSSLPVAEERQMLFDATYQGTEDETETDGNGKRDMGILKNSVIDTINNNNNSYYVYDSQDDEDDEEDDKSNLKTPWSPPQSLAKCAMKSSKTDTNMKNELSVPFIKIGLGRKSVDVEDQVQYTDRSVSSTSFALKWQEKFHDQQLPRDRIVNTLKSVSLSLHDIIRHNHAYQYFTSDTTYVAHPDLLPGENARQLFATVPLAHWRDIFDQMAYIYDNGVLTAEHAVITLIYIERMLDKSKQNLCEANWRLIVLAGLMTAVKVWDDCAVYNMDFVQIFPELDIKHINLIERRFLEHIDWDVSVRCSLFASTYFDLRSYT